MKSKDFIKELKNPILFEAQTEHEIRSDITQQINKCSLNIHEVIKDENIKAN